MGTIINLIKSNKNALKDFVLSTIAYALPVLVTQLLVLPILSKRFGSDGGEYYGYILTILSFISLFPHTIGSTLNNIRLITNRKYVDESPVGDFTILFSISQVVSLVAFCVAVFLNTKSFDFTHFVFLCFLCVLYFAREYIIVIYRVTINYKRICLNSLFFSVGYGVGLLLFYFKLLGNFWEVIYIIGQLFSILYIFISARGIKVSFKKTLLLRNTTISYSKLLFSNIISSLGDNLDKILVFSLLGGIAVSTFYAASIFTKIITLLLSPILSVLLSYLSKKDSISKKTLFYVTLLTFGASIICFFVCILIARPVINILYNEYLTEAIKYIFLTSLIASLRFVYSILRSFMINFKNLNWQILINSLTVGVFIILGMMIVPKMQIYGLCIAYLSGELLRLAITLCVFFISKPAKKEIINE